MPKEKAFKIILVLSVAGVLFSGYLSFQELFLKNCTLGCSNTENILGLPTCFYGFIMFSMIFLTALLGQTFKKK